MRSAWRAWVFVGLLGCGGKSVPPAEPASAAPDQTPALDGTDEEAERTDDDASGDGEGRKTKDRVTSGPAPASVEEAERLLGEDLLRLDQLLQANELAQKNCARVCRSLSSMERSVDAICDLAGDDDDRCTRARDKLDDARGRVQRAQCAC